jgi:flagellar biosynthesis protein FlhF
MQKVRTFQAPSMREALARVKREFGDDAVILGTRSCARAGISGLLGRPGVEITAAPAGAAASLRAGTEGRRQEGTEAPRHEGTEEGVPIPNRQSLVAPPSLPKHVYHYYRQLVENEVADELALRLVRRAATLARGGGAPRPGALQDVLRHAIAKMIPVAGGINLASDAPRRVAFVGPAGAGKTTTLAKLAAHFRLRMRKRVAIVSLDMQRLGGNDSMRRYAEIIGVPMRTAQTVAGVKEVFRTLEPVDLTLIDTHGVCAGDGGHFARLAAVLRAARPDEVHLVLPASMVPRIQTRMAQRFGPLGVSRVVLTHLDEAVGLGVVLNAIEKLEWGLSYLADGETVPNNIEEACAERMAGLIFPQCS